MAYLFVVVLLPDILLLVFFAILSVVKKISCNWWLFRLDKIPCHVQIGTYILYL